MERTPHYTRRSAVGFIGAVLILTGVAEAQDRFGPDDPQRRLYDTPVGEMLRAQHEQTDIRDEQRRELDPYGELIDFEWGGWFQYYTFHFDDGIQKQRLFQQPAAVFWTRIQIDDGAHELFARMRMSYDYFDPGDEYTRQKDWVGPNLDRGWYRVNVGKALRLTRPSDPLQLDIKVGRQEVRWGTGYALDVPLNAVTFDATIHDFHLQGVYGLLSSYANIDRSEPVNSDSDRRIYGLQLSYHGWVHHEPFAYVFWNDDFTEERPRDLFQNYSYDTYYMGLGSRGQIVPNLNYWAEGVIERGKSYGDGDFIRRDDVEAWGLDVGAEYLVDHPNRPRVAAEYMFASGDGHRVFSPSSAAGGNTRGDDSSFVAFGYRDTGLAAAPTLSNLHIWRVGASFAPAPSVEIMRDMELGTNWFLYHKNQRRGAISDPTAGEFSGYVGWEMDYYLNWRLASDISWTIRWGTFFPGSAYDNQRSRHFLFTGVTWSF